MYQHYHFDTTCIIHYIDPQAIVFKDVDPDISKAIHKIVSRVKRYNNLKLVFSNPALGELMYKYIENLYPRDWLRKASQLDYVKPLDNLIKLKDELGDRLILGYYGKSVYVAKFSEVVETVDRHITDIDKHILAHASTDPHTTKFYTTDSEIIYSSRRLEEAIYNSRKEILGVNVKIDIGSPLRLR